MRNYLSRDLEEIRNEMLYDCWEKYKKEINFLTMKELAEIFNINLKTCYRILKAEYRKNNK